MAAARKLFSYLVYVEFLNNVIEFCVEVVEKGHHLRREEEEYLEELHYSVKVETCFEKWFG